MSGSDSGKLQTLLTPTARTPNTGQALINGTGNIVGLVAPNDGNMHLYTVATTLVVSLAETGGAIALTYTSGGQAANVPVSAGTLAAGGYPFTQVVLADPGTAISVTQTSALTAGAARLFGAISGG